MSANDPKQTLRSDKFCVQFRDPDVRHTILLLGSCRSKISCKRTGARWVKRQCRLSAAACAARCVTAALASRCEPPIATAQAAAARAAPHPSPGRGIRTTTTRSSRASLCESSRHRVCGAATAGDAARRSPTRPTTSQARCISRSALYRPENFVPAGHVWTEGQLPWLRSDDGPLRRRRTGREQGGV